MGDIFGGGGRLLDISEDGKTTFADTWLGDLLGFDGSFGVNGPGLKESWNGARRTFEDSARGYVSSKLAQKQAEEQFDTTGIDQYRPMTVPRKATPSSVPDDTEEAMKYGPSPWRKETIEQNKEDALIPRRNDQEAEELLMQRPVTGPEGGPLYSSEETMKMRNIALQALQDSYKLALRENDIEAAKEIRAQIVRIYDARQAYWESVMERGKRIFAGEESLIKTRRTSKALAKDLKTIASSDVIMSLPDKIRGDVKRAIMNDEVSSVVSILDQTGNLHALDYIRERMLVIQMKEEWGAYD